MFRDDRHRIESVGRRSGSALRVHEALKARPVFSLTVVCERTKLSFPAAASAMDLLVKLGIARELRASAGTGSFRTTSTWRSSTKAWRRHEPQPLRTFPSSIPLREVPDVIGRIKADPRGFDGRKEAKLVRQALATIAPCLLWRRESRSREPAAGPDRPAGAQ
jgi:hypothetical protein